MSGNTSIINLVNFVRACEPRMPMDLFQPVKDEMAMAKEHDLPVTWLLQYDSLTEGPFVPYLKAEMPPSHEVGIWFEIVQANAEAAGVKWKGRFPWDWHVNCGFSVGYTPEERERIADVFLSEFKRVFGYYPKTMGSWFFDAHLLAYLHDKYGVRTACNCKDQYGTDGYTLWGGYWANAYYPSKVNAYMPAQNAAAQIDVPVFRMLGSDPLDQLSSDKDGANGQSVITLEPVYPGVGGGNPAWVDWFFRETFHEPHFAMAYAQAGQENSFGAERITKPLRKQCEKIAALRAAGKVRVETLGESGEWFRRNYPVTPVTAQITQNDLDNTGRSGIWYLSRFQRLNFYCDAAGNLRIRDWHVFAEKSEEMFLRSVCTSSACAYLVPAITDCLLWAPCSIRIDSGSPAKIGNVRDEGNEILSFTHGSTRIICSPDSLRADGAESLTLYFNPGSMASGGISIEIQPRELAFHWNGIDYGLIAEHGTFTGRDGEVVFQPENGSLSLKIYVR